MCQLESQDGKDPAEVASLHEQVWERVVAVSETANLEGMSSEELHELAQAVTMLITAMEKACGPAWQTAFATGQVLALESVGTSYRFRPPELGKSIRRLHRPA